MAKLLTYDGQVIDPTAYIYIYPGRNDISPLSLFGQRAFFLGGGKGRFRSSLRQEFQTSPPPRQILSSLWRHVCFGPEENRNVLFKLGKARTWATAVRPGLIKKHLLLLNVGRILILP